MSALLVLAAVTVVQVLGAAHFAEEALSGRSRSWAPAVVALLGGGLATALTIVAGQSLALDLRTRRARSRQDASRGQLDDPMDDPTDEATSSTRGTPRLPGQRQARGGVPGPSRARVRGGVHRAGGR